MPRRHPVSTITRAVASPLRTRAAASASAAPRGDRSLRRGGARVRFRTLPSAAVDPGEPGESGESAAAADDAANSVSYTVPGAPSYPGLYCDWSVTNADTIEVWSYRACLSVVAVSCLVCSSVRES